MMKKDGFTLIEVLLALLIIALAFTALIKALGQTIVHSQQIQDKTIGHLVAKQAIIMIQLNLLPISPGQTINQVTHMLNEDWYWRATVAQLPGHYLQKITITISKNHHGPFSDSLTAYRFSHG
ncbi:MAG: type II secretion system minor pseudopilin GspI [Legionella sp.]